MITTDLLRTQRSMFRAIEELRAWLDALDAHDGDEPIPANRTFGITLLGLQATLLITTPSAQHSPDDRIVVIPKLLQCHSDGAQDFADLLDLIHACQSHADSLLPVAVGEPDFRD